ncbi:hypothetical protein [Roseicella sp. DB1501]|uniref:hypothetical protein n=1 Tax=Roseicella sp. DB1501 TaxID=2730925 RepID=UPI001491599B|nr:hypothetical protein [Roseicella sp. DB1501]NOG74102.1 hypothetical protein [Roseicella sp. DB1501]
MEPWKPITSAPRDGSTILAYLPAPPEPDRRQDVVAIFWDAVCGWATAYSGARLDSEPTYWMPLPAPPGQEAAAAPLRRRRRASAPGAAGLRL